MTEVITLLRSRGDVAGRLGALAGMEVYPRSVVEREGSVYFMGRRDGRHLLGILSQQPDAPDFELRWHDAVVGDAQFKVGVGEENHANAVALRQALPYTAPRVVGVLKSVGLGDRLGIATPGHIHALRRAPGMVPVLAQQSIREMERTERTADEVMDSATWGVFQEGWQAGYGADADHLKRPEDIDYCARSGFVWYTFDPRDHVDNDAETDDVSVLRTKYEGLPWSRLDTSPDATRTAYAGKSWDLDGLTLTLSEVELLRAACKYGRALAHLADMYRHLERVMGHRPFEVEISVDETETPTRPGEHFYVASELKRLGVTWTSLAPRYIGRFEKGVDYIGDLQVFEQDFAQQVAVAKALGPYKLSLHSGSDKFSIYPIAARVAGDLVHLKTAGTSYLEALRAVARVDAGLFREILAFAIAHYEEDRASYHVSADVGKMIAPDAVSDSELPDVLDQFDTRQALHVTFGSVLTFQDEQGDYVFKDRLYEVLKAHEDEHYAALEAHIAKHMAPFSDR